MNHDYIEQFDIVDRYVMSRLSAEEKELFEQHFIDCPQCVDSMKTTRGLTQGFRLFTLQQAARQKSNTAEKTEWFFLQWLSRKTLAVAACGLLLGIILISIFSILQVSRLRREAARSESAALDLQHRYEYDQQSALEFARSSRETEQGLKGHIQQLEAELQKAQKGGIDAAGATGDWVRPFINLPIVVLDSVRASKVTEINLSRAPMSFVISVPLEGQAKYQTYRVTVLKDQRPVWESNKVKPDQDNALTIGFNSSFFQPGKYALQVEGVPAASGSGENAIYPFHINKRQ